MSTAGSDALRVWEGRAVAEWQHAWGVPELHVLARTTSTNDLARDVAGSAPSGAAFIAEVQTQGRGQHGRRWDAQAGASLLVSVILRARVSEAPGAAPLRVGIAVADAIAEVTRAQPDLKWPNDVLLDGGKVAGILCEGVIAHSSTVIIAGIGINVQQHERDLPQGLEPPATSLRIVTGADVARAELAGALLRRLRALESRIALPLDDEELRAFDARDVLRGHSITVDGVSAGIAAGVNADGELRVEQQDGHVQRVHSGTVRAVTVPGTAQKRAR